ncbi:MAG: alcohol dehydrogenase catalytic domain-containing protein [Planctomycetota bacterium]
MTSKWGKLEVVDRPVPEPGVGQVRIRTTLAGVCGSDVHIFQGHHPTAVCPVVQGHEFVGTVEAVGPDTALSVERGARVVVEPLISCGKCEACRRGHFHVCRHLKLLGIHADGAFGEYFLAPAEKLIAVPEGLSDRAAVLAEPFAVGVHVCERARLELATRVLVVGAGPIGLVVGMVARACGARVAVSEVSDERLELAASFGFATIDAKGSPGADAAAEAEAFTDGDGFDTTFEVSGSAPGLGLAMEATRVRGAVVQVGFFSEPPKVDLFKLTLKELAYAGSRVYTNEDFRRTLRLLEDLTASGVLEPDRLISEQTGLDGIGSAMDRMMKGAVLGKIVVDPST